VWTKEDVRTLKALAREKVKTSGIARRQKRTVGATYQQAFKLKVSLGGGAKKRDSKGQKRKAPRMRGYSSIRSRA